MTRAELLTLCRKLQKKSPEYAGELGGFAAQGDLQIVARNQLIQALQGVAYWAEMLELDVEQEEERYRYVRDT